MFAGYIIRYMQNFSEFFETQKYKFRIIKQTRLLVLMCIKSLSHRLSLSYFFEPNQAVHGCNMFEFVLMMFSRLFMCPTMPLFSYTD
jgi:hypothetical protein